MSCSVYGVYSRLSLLPDKHFDKLSSTNYATWSVSMLDYRVIKDCFAAIEYELNGDGAFGGSPAANIAEIASSKLALSYMMSNCDDRWVRRLVVPPVYGRIRLGHF